MRYFSHCCVSLGFVALLGCAPLECPPKLSEHVPAPEWQSPTSEGAVIDGVVRDSRTGAGMANAVVVLQCLCLEPQESYTDDRGIYWFTELPPGEYTVQVLAGSANVSKIGTVPKGSTMRVDFELDPDYDGGRFVHASRHTIRTFHRREAVRTRRCARR